jgi:hypothetical protein
MLGKICRSTSGLCPVPSVVRGVVHTPDRWLRRRMGKPAKKRKPRRWGWGRVFGAVHAKSWPSGGAKFITTLAGMKKTSGRGVSVRLPRPLKSMPLSAAGNVKRGRDRSAVELCYDKAFGEGGFRERVVFRAAARAHVHARRARCEAREPPSNAQRGEGRAVEGTVLR